MMQRIGMYLIVLMLVGVIFLSGCVEVNSPQDSFPFYITQFKIEPGVITQGDTANLSWIVIGGKSVSIDNGIGNVSLTGSRVVAPKETTTYTLTAKNATGTLTVTTQIFVTKLFELSEPDENASIDMKIYERDTYTGTIIWFVSEITGNPVEDDSYIAFLKKEDSSVETDANITFEEINIPGYINPEDRFIVTVSQEGYYKLYIEDKNTGELLFKSPLTFYEMKSTTISMSLYIMDDASNTNVWLVTDLYGDEVPYYLTVWSLLNDTGANASGSVLVFNDNDGDGLISIGDSFNVTACCDGYFIFMLAYRSIGGIIFKSSMKKY